MCNLKHMKKEKIGYKKRLCMLYNMNTEKRYILHAVIQHMTIAGITFLGFYKDVRISKMILQKFPLSFAFVSLRVQKSLRCNQMDTCSKGKPWYLQMVLPLHRIVELRQDVEFMDCITNLWFLKHEPNFMPRDLERMASRIALWL